MNRALSVTYYNFPTPTINKSSLKHRALSVAYYNFPTSAINTLSLKHRALSVLQLTIISQHLQINTSSKKL